MALNGKDQKEAVEKVAADIRGPLDKFSGDPADAGTLKEALCERLARLTHDGILGPPSLNIGTENANVEIKGSLWDQWTWKQKFKSWVMRKVFKSHVLEVRKKIDEVFEEGYEQGNPVPDPLDFNYSYMREELKYPYWAILCPKHIMIVETKIRLNQPVEMVEIGDITLGEIN